MKEALSEMYFHLGVVANDADEGEARELLDVLRHLQHFDSYAEGARDARLFIVCELADMLDEPPLRHRELIATARTHVEEEL
jgi:hypothetical protein